MANETNLIQLKRGLIANVAEAVAQYGEPLVAFNPEKSALELYIGTGENDGKGKILVNPAIPTNVSAFTNDSGFQTASDVATAIATAIAGKGTASFEKVSAVPDVADAKDNVLYLVMNAETKHYDIYAKIDDKMEWIDDITVDLSGYVTTEALNTALANYVQKDGDKVLSDNNYDDTAKAAVDGLPDALAGKMNVGAGIDGGTF